MAIDVERALAAPPSGTELAWDHKDVLLYHLGVGAGTPATDPGELRYTLESGLRVLPSFATVAGGLCLAAADGLALPGLEEVDLAAVLHAGQRIGLHRALPAAGRVSHSVRVAAVHDKGKAALVVLRSAAADADGPLWSGETSLYVRGEGGFGGERGATERQPPPGREPDRGTRRRIREDQALLYRLSGDWNPLHADPEFAARAGFDRPVLHGLCTYGVTLKAVTDTVLGGDVTRIHGFAARFAGVVLPGEDLDIRMWEEPDRTLVTVTAPDRGDAPVLADTVVEHA